VLLFQRVNLENFFAINSQLPIGIQLFASDFDPRYDKAGPVFWEFSC
jgi:hypothetical protein